MNKNAKAVIYNTLQNALSYITQIFQEIYVGGNTFFICDKDTFLLCVDAMYFDSLGRG
jgi:hypothetical protein